MKRFALLLVTGLALGACVQAPASDARADGRCPGPAAIGRTYASPTAFFASSVTIPPGYETLRLPGIVADPPAGGGFGDTEQQTESVLAKIAAALAQRKASEADVVAMTVYLVAPASGGTMDFDGMMRAYSRHYGSAAQPNRPVRSTVQVAGLVRPGILVEIEVTAAVVPLTPCDFMQQLS